MAQRLVADTKAVFFINFQSLCPVADHHIHGNGQRQNRCIIHMTIMVIWMVIPTCNIPAHTDKTRGSYLFRSHVSSCITTPFSFSIVTGTDCLSRRHSTKHPTAETNPHCEKEYNNVRERSAVEEGKVEGDHWNNRRQWASIFGGLRYYWKQPWNYYYLSIELINIWYWSK